LEPYLKLPSRIKGLLSTQNSAEYLWKKYHKTRKPDYLASLVEMYNQARFHYLLTLTDTNTAEDILQTLWLKVMKLNLTNQKDIVVKPWLFKVARNTLIDELRRTNRFQFEELNEQTIEYHVNQTSGFEDKLSKFNWAITQLSLVQKEVFIFQQEGLSMEDICEITGENFETVKSRLRYARANLKRLMS